MAKCDGKLKTKRFIWTEPPLLNRKHKQNAHIPSNVSIYDVYTALTVSKQNNIKPIMENNICSLLIENIG